jgi:hypothetical protein
MTDEFVHAFGLCLTNPRYFEQDSPRLNHGNPVIDRSLPFPHPRFRRVLGDRFVRENTNPNLGIAVRLASDGRPASLNLPRGDPRRR